jgi:hypothetical protein
MHHARLSTRRPLSRRHTRLIAALAHGWSAVACSTMAERAGGDVVLDESHDDFAR